jgi:hypothetical protein
MWQHHYDTCHLAIDIMNVFEQRSAEGWELVAVTGGMESGITSSAVTSFGEESIGLGTQQSGFHFFWKRPAPQQP